MSRKTFSTVGALVDDLLDRFERNPAASRLTTSIDPDKFHSVDARDAFDEGLLALERAGGVTLVRKGLKGERIVTSVRLTDATVLYGHLGRRPSHESTGEALLVLRSRNNLSPAAILLLDEIAAAWARGVASNGFPPGKVARLRQAIALAEAVHGRLAAPGDDEVDYRSFSRQMAGDSKALERHLRQVASLTRRLFDLDATRAGLEPADLLASAGIVRLAQPMLVRGPMAFDQLSFPAMPFIGIPGECHERITLTARPDYLLIIENFASFVRHVREVSACDRGLVIFSGGFPSRPTRRLICRLAALARVPTFHWGDMDAGGVQIFRYLESALAAEDIPLIPHLMGAPLLRDHGTKVSAPAKLTGFEGSAVRDLALLIGEASLAHEQEAFDPVTPSWEGK